MLKMAGWSTLNLADRSATQVESISAWRKDDQQGRFAGIVGALLAAPSAAALLVSRQTSALLSQSVSRPPGAEYLSNRRDQSSPGSAAARGLAGRRRDTPCQCPS